MFLCGIVGHMERYIKLLRAIIMPNGHRDRETPEPIPNSEAKPVHDVEYCPNGWENTLLFGIALILKYIIQIVESPFMESAEARVLFYSCEDHGV